jgi:glyoxylase-like metal-dependent hydrolase (beta-lactamase superfamily II)
MIGTHSTALHDFFDRIPENEDRKGKRMQRREFILSTAVAAALGVGSAAAQTAATSETARRWKGHPDSKVKRWDVITVGNLSRNRYWGEPNTAAVRSVLCTTTLVAGEDFVLLVDPSMKDDAAMARELDRRTGKKPEYITACFVTHEHGDHWAGLEGFSKAKWFAAPGVAEVLNQTAKLSKQIEGVEGKLFDAIDVVATPGHTANHHALRFDCDGRSIVTAGDSVATLDFFRNRQGFYNSVDFDQAARSMDKLAALADIIVPGHDNYFLVD